MKKPYEQAPGKGDLLQQKPANPNERRQPVDLSQPRTPGQFQGPAKPVNVVKPGDAPKQPERAAKPVAQQQEPKNS